MKSLLEAATPAFALSAALMGFGLLTVSCNQTSTNSLPGADTFCAAGSAQIQIGDGYQLILCGCAEPGGQVIGSGSGTLTCTVPVGTEVFFFYQATHLTHQLIPSAGSAFPASPLSDPTATLAVTVDAFQPQVAETYGYVDAFNAGVVGQIVAQ